MPNFEEAKVEKLVKAWELLNVTPSTSEDDVKAAAKKIRVFYHPSRHGDTKAANDRASSIAEFCEMAIKTPSHSVEFQEAARRFNSEERKQARLMVDGEIKRGGKAVSPLDRLQQIEQKIPEMVTLSRQALVAQQQRQQALARQQAAAAGGSRQSAGATGAGRRSTPPTTSPQPGNRAIRQRPTHQAFAGLVPPTRPASQGGQGNTSASSTSSAAGGGAVPPTNSSDYYRGRSEAFEEALRQAMSRPQGGPANNNPPPPQQSAPMSAPSPSSMPNKNKLLGTVMWFGVSASILAGIYMTNIGNLAKGWDANHFLPGAPVNIGIAAILGLAALAVTRGTWNFTRNNWKWMLGAGLIAGAVAYQVHNNMSHSASSPSPGIQQSAPANPDGEGPSRQQRGTGLVPTSPSVR